MRPPRSISTVARCYARAGIPLTFAWLAGFVSERGWGNSIVRAVTGMLLALGVIYLGGWSWLAMLTDARTAFATGVAPFVLADVVKVALGAALLPKAGRILARV